jgi:hypothetical protein
MLVSESFVDATQGVRFGVSEPYEPYTDDIGRLFRDMQKEYGRCVGAVYVDAAGTKIGDNATPPEKPKRIGWVFQKRLEYEDARESWSADRRFYIREVWVTLHDAVDTVTHTHHYHDLGAK